MLRSESTKDQRVPQNLKILSPKNRAGMLSKKTLQGVIYSKLCEYIQLLPLPTFTQKFNQNRFGSIFLMFAYYLLLAL